MGDRYLMSGSQLGRLMSLICAGSQVEAQDLLTDIQLHQYLFDSYKNINSDICYIKKVLESNQDKDS